MVQKRQFGVNKYLNDYRVVSYQNEKGKTKRRVEYIGDWYVPQIGKKEQRRLNIWLWILSVIAMPCVVAALLLPYAAEGELYVVLPAAASLLPGWYLIRGCLSLPRAGLLMEKIQYEHGYLRIGRAATGVSILVGIGAIGAIVFDILCLTHKADAQIGWFDLLFLGIMLFVIGGMIILMIKARSIPVSVEGNDKK